MPQGFLKRVHRVIHRADIVLEVCDARFPELTRNRNIEERIIRNGKRIILVLNKADLAGKKVLQGYQKQAGMRTVFLSARTKNGIRKLREAIGKEAGSKEITIAVIGFPNTGKSSLINALKGKHVSRVSAKAGFTRGEQVVRINEKMCLIDSPGIIPYAERDPYKLVLLGAKNPQDVPDVELAALFLLKHLREEMPEKLETLMGKESVQKEPGELLELLAYTWNALQRGGKANTHAAASKLLMHWQAGTL